VILEHFLFSLEARNVSMNPLQRLENPRRFQEAVEPWLRDG
jgi:hypothetical protein